jgi:hypothetical protein
MGRIDARIAELGLVLPGPLKVPAGVVLPFAFVNVRGDRAFVAGHGPQAEDGSVAGPFGKVGAEVTLEEARDLAARVALAVLGSLRRALGDLDRITGWGRVFGMVSSAPGFTSQPAVINGFSDVILDVFGPEVGRHARSAVGLAVLPFDIAVEIEAEVLIGS